MREHGQFLDSQFTHGAAIDGHEVRDCKARLRKASKKPGNGNRNSSAAELIADAKMRAGAEG